MIAEQIQPPQNTSYLASAKYYQFSAILEHVIDCFHTIVTDESNPYHPPLAWLTRKQPKPPDEELFLDLLDECSKHKPNYSPTSQSKDNVQLSSNTRSRLEKCPQQSRQEIVSRSRDGCAPLFMACKNGLTRIVKYLLDVCGADIEQKGCFEAPEDHRVHSVAPIWIAAVSGHLDTVKLLIDRGANVNSISDTGSTPLRSVCFLCKDDDGNEDQDSLYEDDGYNFGAPAEAGATSDKYIEIVHLLVNHGADVKRANYSGGTCLINSLHNYHLAKFMISRGADVNAPDNQSKTALHYAIQHNRVSVVKLLLENGADPLLKTKNGDDALRLCCIGGSEENFKHLLRNHPYNAQTVADAYKLLGSSVLEIQCDLARVRDYWTKAVETDDKQCEGGSQAPCSDDTNSIMSHNNARRQIAISSDKRRSIAFGDTIEFTTNPQMQSLTMDDYRMQSLLISERILGPGHPETIQRLLYRGTFYINSLRPNRCLDLWIYALKLRLEHDSIFRFESIFAAQAITKLFLDLVNQRQIQQIRFGDVYDVLRLLVDRLSECQLHLSWRPRSCLHEDIYDLMLNMIVKLLLIMRCAAKQAHEFRLANNLILELAKLNPKSTSESSLLHMCVNPNLFEGDIYRSLQIASEVISVGTSEAPTSELSRQVSTTEQQARNRDASLPIVRLIGDLIGAGLDVDALNCDGLSPMQMLCLAASVRVDDKTKIIRLLVARGAHVDRRALTPEQDERVQQTLRECGIKPLGFVTLKCLAARRVSELKLSFDKTMLAYNLNESIAIH